MTAICYAQRMPLPETYARIRESIVAFIPKVFPAGKDGAPPQIPPIFGTGYVVDEDGIIATNRHVVDAFKKFPNAPGHDEETWPVCAMLFHRIEAGMAEIPLDVLGVVLIESFVPGEVYYGPAKPDLALVHVKARGLAAVTVDGEAEIREGMTVATAGFPMGSELLTAPGWLHQITPTLQQGIVAAVHPFVAPKPHGFSLNIMVQGGASGSPIFLPETGAVVGTVYASLGEPSPVWGVGKDGKKEATGIVRLPTAISHAVPAHYLARILDQVPTDPQFRAPLDAKTVEEMIAAAELVDRSRGAHAYTPVDEDDGEPKPMIRPGKTNS